MTRQEMFDKVVAALRKQRSRSYNTSEGMCAYKSGNKKCAVGHLLTSEEMKVAKGTFGSVETLYYRFRECPMDPKRGTVVTKKNMRFLESLQALHDKPKVILNKDAWRISSEEYNEASVWREDFEKAIPIFAKKWKLKVPKNVGTTGSSKRVTKRSVGASK